LWDSSAQEFETCHSGVVTVDGIIFHYLADLISIVIYDIVETVNMLLCQDAVDFFHTILNPPPKGSSEYTITTLLAKPFSPKLVNESIFQTECEDLSWCWVAQKGLYSYFLSTAFRKKCGLGNTDRRLGMIFWFFGRMYMISRFSYFWFFFSNTNISRIYIFCWKYSKCYIIIFFGYGVIHKMYMDQELYFSRIYIFFCWKYSNTTLSFF